MLEEEKKWKEANKSYRSISWIIIRANSTTLRGLHC